MSNRHSLALLACSLMLAVGNFTPVLASIKTPSIFCPPSGRALPNCTATNGQLPVRGEKVGEFSEKEAFSPSRDEQVGMCPQVPSWLYLTSATNRRRFPLMAVPPSESSCSPSRRTFRKWSSRLWVSSERRSR